MAFANDPDNYLPKLDQEERELGLLFSPLHQRNYLDHFAFGRASRERVSAELRRVQGRVAVFHYSGHAHGQGLKLEGGEASSLGIARLLALEPDLKFVFLNGCSTLEQVDGLLDARVKAVIATRADIKDSDAVAFSIDFYNSLAGGESVRQSFQRAAAALNAKDAHRLGGVNIVYRKSILRDPHAQKDIFPWGIYCRDDADLDWKLPDRTTNEISLPIPPAQDPPLYRTLTTLNYSAQIPLLRRGLRRSSVCAFVIHGTPKNGHTWLGYNLLKAIQNTRDTQLSRPVRFGVQVASVTDYLRELRRDLAGERAPKIGPLDQEVAYFTDLLLQKLKHQTVILQAHDASFILDPQAFESFFSNFWRPLAHGITQKTQADPAAHPYKLALLLIEEKHQLEPSPVISAEDAQPGAIAWLPPLTPVSPIEFLAWLKADLMRPDSVLYDHFDGLMDDPAFCDRFFEGHQTANIISLFEKISDSLGYDFFHDELGRWMLEPQ